MKASGPLKDMLGDLAQSFNDGDRPDVYFPGDSIPGKQGFAPAAMASDQDGNIILNPDVEDHYDLPEGVSGANQLRLLTDALHHEVEHLRQSDLSAKKDISDEHGALAGTIWNIVEDQYINRTRTERHRGMRRALRFKAEKAVMQAMGDVSDLPEGRRLPAALSQLCWGGYVKGFTDLPDEEREFLAWARGRINDARYDNDQQGRIDAAVEIADRMADINDVADWGELPEWMEDFIEMMRQELEDADASDGAGQSMPGGQGEGAGQGGDGDGEAADGEEGEDGDGAAGGDGDGEDGESGDSGGAGDDEGDGEEEGAGGDGDGEDGGEGDQGGDGGGAPPERGEEKEDYEEDRAILDAADQGDSGANDWYRAGSSWMEPDPSYQRRYDLVRREEQKEATDLGFYYDKREYLLGLDRQDTYRALDEWDRRDEAWPEFSNQETVSYRDKRRLDADDVADEFDQELAHEIEDAFRQFKTRPVERPAKEGPRLHRQNVVRYLAGERSVKHLKRRPETRQELGDRVVGVAVDQSGSMRKDEKAAKMAVAAIAKACEAIDDEFICTTWQTTERLEDGSGQGPYDVDLGIVTGPDEEFEFDHLDAMNAGGYDPAAKGALFTAELMDRVSAREKVLIVIHDGYPHIGLDVPQDAESARAMDDMRRVANTLRQDGVKVLGLGAGSDINEEALGEMFGDEGWLTTAMDGLTDALVEVYRDQMDVNLAGAR